mmetsp:Transcript_26272/g.57782  ORF Transcript_26272/g.57782 Transcript_26272/m.57782 type:complete len:275 (-) Transcript_26272:154-978(-)
MAGSDMTFGARIARPSSNNFASGTNQNYGNSISDTPSTRVARPPGGESSFSFGWEEPGPPRRAAPGAGCDGLGAQVAAGARGAQAPSGPSEYVAGGRLRVSGNSYASGANQNSGNVLSDVASTRVSAPPGGASSFSFGWSGDAEPPSRAAGRSRQSYGAVPEESPYATDEAAQGRRGGMREPQCGSSRMAGLLSWDDPKGLPAAGAPGQGSRDRAQPTAGYGGGEVIHGRRPRESSNTFANGSDQNCGNVISDRASTRVIRPPGGASSLSLGWS